MSSQEPRKKTGNHLLDNVIMPLMENKDLEEWIKKNRWTFTEEDYADESRKYAAGNIDYYNDRYLPYKKELDGYINDPTNYPIREYRLRPIYIFMNDRNKKYQADKQFEIEMNKQGLTPDQKSAIFRAVHSYELDPSVVITNPGSNLAKMADDLIEKYKLKSVWKKEFSNI